MKKLYLLLLNLIFVIFLASCNNSNKAKIISTSFAGYDFARAVSKDIKTSSMLLKPGEELHDYSPSVYDIETILDSEIFIYIGGESDNEWVEKQIIPYINKDKTTIINMMEVVEEKGNIYDEEDPDSSIKSDEIDVEEDEHIWNSITNAKIIVEEICNVLINIDKENEDKYINNKNEYINELNGLDNEIKNINNLGTKPLIFADRFPLLYFVKEYNLKYDAAFKGCETSKEANPNVIESLIKKIKENDIKIIFIIELSESKIADTIINTLKNEKYEIEKKTFYSMHNVSKKDYKEGKTYIDFVKDNIESLKTFYK